MGHGIIPLDGKLKLEYDHLFLSEQLKKAKKEKNEKKIMEIIKEMQDILIAIDDY